MGDNGGKKGKGHQGTCLKDPWTKPKGGWTGAVDSGSKKMDTIVFEQQ